MTPIDPTNKPPRPNLPLPPVGSPVMALPRPAASPNGSTAIRQKASEVGRRAGPSILNPSRNQAAPSSVTPVGTTPYVGMDGRVAGAIPQPPAGPPAAGAAGIPPPPSAAPGGQAPPADTAGGFVPGQAGDPQKGTDAQLANNAADAKLEQERQEAGPPPPPKKLSPLGANSPIERHLGPRADGQAHLTGMEQHLREIGIGDGSLPPDKQKSQEQAAVRDFQRIGRYIGDDDPASPAPPIRPGKYSYVPGTGWLKPEGKPAVLDRVVSQIQAGRFARGGK